MRLIRSIAIVCGLKSEADVVGRALAALNAGERASVYVSGANAQMAEELAQVAIAEDGAVAVLSIGISGALASDLAPGDLLIGEKVVTSNAESFACDSGLLQAILAPQATPPLARSARGGRGGEAPRVIPTEAGSASQDDRSTGATRGDTPPLPPLGFAEGGRARAETPGASLAVLLGSDTIIASAAEKERLLLSTGAVAVDMESHGAARAAARAKAPFLAIRAIADPAHRALPKSALGAVAPDGSTRIVPTLMKAAVAPWEFPALLRLGADSDKALKTLGRDLGGLLGALFLRLDL